MSNMSRRMYLYMHTKTMHIYIYIYINVHAHKHIYICIYIYIWIHHPRLPPNTDSGTNRNNVSLILRNVYIDQTAPSTSAEPSTFKRLSCEHVSSICMMLSNTSAALASQSDLDLFFDSISKLGRCSPRPSALTCRVARECSHGQELRSWPKWKCGPSHGPWACGWIKL